MLYEHFNDHLIITCNCFLIFSAFLRDFSLWLDQLSGDGAPTLGAALLYSSWAGTDLWLYPEFDHLIVHRDGVYNSYSL